MYEVTSSGIANTSVPSSKGIGFWRTKGQKYKIKVLCPLTSHNPSIEIFYSMLQLTETWLDVDKQSIKWINKGNQEL